MEFYAARQPIFDLEQRVYAYELLFRDGVTNSFPDIDGNKATAKIVEGSQFDFSLMELTANKLAFINFTYEALRKNYPSLIPNTDVVIEILETEKPDKKLLSQVKSLHKSGYAIALDDYEHQASWRHFFPYIHIIKVDFLQSSIDKINQIIDEVKHFPNIALLAEKIETQYEFELAKKLGFTYFQGYFFARPQMVVAKSLTPAKASLAQVLNEISQVEYDINKVSAMFELDINLAYKLLRYSNGTIFRRQRKISSIKQALVVLGTKELKKFVSVIFTAQLAAEKPPELMAMSLTRAHFSQGLAVLSPKVDDTSVAFLTGMLSLIDVLLEQDMSQAMCKLPLSSEIKLALSQGIGVLAQINKVIVAYERSHWHQVSEELAQLQIDESKVPDLYETAVHFSNENMKFMLTN